MLPLRKPFRSLLLTSHSTLALWGLRAPSSVAVTRHAWPRMEPCGQGRKFCVALFDQMGLLPFRSHVAPLRHLPSSCPCFSSGRCGGSPSFWRSPRRFLATLCCQDRFSGAFFFPSQRALSLPVVCLFSILSWVATRQGLRWFLTIPECGLSIRARYR